MAKKRAITWLLFLSIFAAFHPLFARDISQLKPINQSSLQSIVSRHTLEYMIPGVYVLLRTPQGEFTVSCGTTLRGSDAPPLGHTHFRIASATKTMTAAVIVQQAQEEKIAFGDFVSKYISKVPNGDQITIADLLRMRSGLYNYTDSHFISESLDKDPQKVWTSNEILDIAFSKPPLFKPGTSYHYSNTNYALLGMIAEKIDGKPLEKIFQDRLFKPLGMKNSLLPERRTNNLPIPFSHGYLYGSASYALVDKPYPSVLRTAGKLGILPPNDDTFQNPSYALAAGGVISTADDLAVWIKALADGNLGSVTSFL